MSLFLHLLSAGVSEFPHPGTSHEVSNLEHMTCACKVRQHGNVLAPQHLCIFICYALSAAYDTKKYPV